MKILIACEESQAVAKEMRRLGHEAYSCDILECSGGHPEWHILGDCIPLLNGRCSFRTMDGMQLAPTEIVKPERSWCPSGSYSGKHGEKHRGMFTRDRARNRAKTFPGIAAAMSEQWAGECRT